MIHRLSGRIAFLFCEKKVIKNDMTEVYAYGLELLIATLLTGLILSCMAAVLGIFCKTVLLMIPFIIIRSNAGGYHAKTHIGCIISFISTYLLSVWIIVILPGSLHAVFSAVSLLASFITVLSLGCIPNGNRPVTDVERLAFDKKCKTLSFFLTAVGLVFLNVIPGYGIYFSTGLLLAAGSMIVEKILLKREKKYECHKEITK